MTRSSDVYGRRLNYKTSSVLMFIAAALSIFLFRIDIPHWIPPIVIFCCLVPAFFCAMKSRQLSKQYKKLRAKEVKEFKNSAKSLYDALARIKPEDFKKAFYDAIKMTKALNSTKTPSTPIPPDDIPIGEEEES